MAAIVVGCDIVQCDCAIGIGGETVRRIKLKLTATGQSYWLDDGGIIVVIQINTNTCIGICNEAVCFDRAIAIYQQAASGCGFGKRICAGHVTPAVPYLLSIRAPDVPFPIASMSLSVTTPADEITKPSPRLLLNS